MRSDPFNLSRFVDAQSTTFDRALAELRAGAKRTHWMWFILPQLEALGRSPTAKFYGIHSLAEARAYLEHSILGPRLMACVEALLPWTGIRSAEQILGPVDALKFRSCLTLFDATSGDTRFVEALVGFYDGGRDPETVALLNRT